MYSMTPVSGTAYAARNGYPHLVGSLTVTLNPTAVSTASVVLEVSEDGTTWTTYATASASGVSLAGFTQQLMVMTTGAGWWRATAVNATLGQMVVN